MPKQMDQSGSQIEGGQQVQGGIEAGGDVNIGGDAASKDRTLIQRLIEQFEEERANNQQFDDTVEMLEHYRTPLEDEVVGLEEKLNRADREHLYDRAKRHKEAFTKKLMKLGLYESAQHIFVFLLGRIENRFQNEVEPLIREGASEKVVLEVLSVRIVEPLIDELGENPLYIVDAHVQGMVYFLTGNCYLEWKADQ